MSAFTVDQWDTSRRSVARLEFGDERADCRSIQVESTPKGRKVELFLDPDGNDGNWQRLTLRLPDGSVVEVRGSDFFFIHLTRVDGSVGWLTTDEPETESTP